MNQMNFVSNKIKLCVLVAVVVIASILLVGVVKERKIEKNITKIYNIINEKDYEKINYLREILTLESDDVFLVNAQLEAIHFLGECRDKKSTNNIILFHKQSINFIEKRRCLFALSRIGTLNAAEFMKEELLQTKNELDRIFIYERFFEMYFIGDSEVQNIIYQSYKEVADIERIFLEKYIILYFEGESDYYEELLKIVLGENLELKELLSLTLNTNRVRSIDKIIQNAKLMSLIKKLYEEGNDYIRVNLEKYIK